MTDFLFSVLVGALVLASLCLLDQLFGLSDAFVITVQAGLGVILVLWVAGSVVRTVYALVQRLID